MKTKKPVLSTTPFYDEFPYYHDDNELAFLSENPSMFDYFSKNTLAFYQFAGVLTQIYEIASFISFLINLFHLCVLTRKELRSNVVYIVMIGICISDLLQSLATICGIMMLWNIVYHIEPCWGAYRYSHTMLILLAKTSQIMSRRCSSFFALFIALIRALAILFPLSGRIGDLLKPKVGIFVMLFSAAIFGAWSSVFARQMKFKKYKDYECDVGQAYPSYTPYEMISDQKWEVKYYGVDGYIAITVCLAYVVVAMVLAVAIRKANRRSEELTKEKSSNTSMLIIVMALSMFISEVTYGSLYLANLHYFQGFGEQQFLKVCDAFVLTLQIINSATHCLMCFCMSSLYRNTVKQMFWRKTNQVAVSKPTVEGGGSSRNSDGSY